MDEANAIALGQNFSLILLKDGSLYGMGANGGQE
jgi:alpha-tubulin suppressor-like RCC1 family protein